jgi:hypothetical protein
VIRLRRTARLQAHARPAKNKRPHRGTPCARGTEATADGGEGVGGLHTSVDVGERGGARTRPSKGGPCGGELQEGIMSDASTSGGMSPQLLEVVERARREPEGRFHSLAHLIDVSALERAYRAQGCGGGCGWSHEGAVRAGAGAKSPGPARADEGEALSPSADPACPHPEGRGKARPIGISAFEDKFVQDAVREVLEAIYEQDSAPMASGPDAVPITPCGPSTGSCTRAR